MAAAAIGLFGFAINADLISGPTGLLNQLVIYELWKFIRDFCNIFFILMLLIGAFRWYFSSRATMPRRHFLVSSRGTVRKFQFPLPAY